MFANAIIIILRYILFATIRYTLLVDIHNQISSNLEIQYLVVQWQDICGYAPPLIGWKPKVVRKVKWSERTATSLNMCDLGWRALCDRRISNVLSSCLATGNRTLCLQNNLSCWVTIPYAPYCSLCMVALSVVLVTSRWVTLALLTISLETNTIFTLSLSWRYSRFEKNSRL